jgi:hypothetical protein
MGSPKQHYGQSGEDQIGEPGAQPGVEKLVPAQSLAGFDTAIVCEAEQDPKPEAIGQSGASCIGAKDGAQCDDDKTSQREGYLEMQVDLLAGSVFAVEGGPFDVGG